MSKQSQVIAAYRKNMNRFSNASGGNGGFYNAGGNQQLANSPNNAARRVPGWSANGGGNMGQTAPQYILTISNASASSVSNFDVFGASLYLTGSYNGATWNANGSLTKNGVTISSGLPNVTYQQILTSVSYKPVTVGSVYLQALSGSNSQVTDAYQITSQSAAGELYQVPVVPILDGYQFQAGITYNNASFNVEPMTKLTWNMIYPSAVFQIRIFTANIIDPSNALNGNQVQNQFSRPRVIGNLS